MTEKIEHTGIVPEELGLRRLDHIAAALFPEYSRSRLKLWIESGELLVNGEHLKPKTKLSVGAELEISAEPDESVYLPEDIPLNVIYEDDTLLVLNKPANLVVHPGAGNYTGTILNGLLFRYPLIAGVPRAGIVHRLDKDTTGLMVVAKTLQAQTHLVEQLQARSVKRIYQAVVYGKPKSYGKIDEPIARHPTMRTKMSVQKFGRESMTHYRTLELYKYHSHVQLQLETGRTHQIRVHMQYLGFPLIGDPTYGGTFRIPANSPAPSLVGMLKNFPRQALHAKELSFIHPETHEEMSFETDLPQDMRDLLSELAEHGA